MARFTGKVAFINPAKAGNRSGNVKLEDGTYIGIPNTRVHEMVKGGLYEFECTEKTVNGRTYFDMITMSRQGGNAPPHQPTQQSYQPQRSNGNGGSTHYSPVGDDNKDRQIFVTGVVGRAMQSGKFGVDDIYNLAMAASAAFTSAMRPAAPERPTSNRDEQELNDRIDDIPYS